LLTDESHLLATRQMQVLQRAAGALTHTATSCLNEQPMPIDALFKVSVLDQQALSLMFCIS